MFDGYAYSSHTRLAMQKTAPTFTVQVQVQEHHNNTILNTCYSSILSYFLSGYGERSNHAKHMSGNFKFRTKSSYLHNPIKPQRQFCKLPNSHSPLYETSESSAAATNSTSSSSPSSACPRTNRPLQPVSREGIDSPGRT